MWIKLDNKLLNCSIIRRLSLPQYNGDSQGNTRVLTVLKIFIESANGISWFNSHDYSSWCGQKGKSIQYVWDYLVDNGVLMPDDTGRYSAVKWLTDNNIFGKELSPQPAQDRTGF